MAKEEPASAPVSSPQCSTDSHGFGRQQQQQQPQEDWTPAPSEHQQPQEDWTPAPSEHQQPLGGRTIPFQPNYAEVAVPQPGATSHFDTSPSIAFPVAEDVMPDGSASDVVTDVSDGNPSVEGKKIESVRVNIRVLDRLMTLAGELVLTRNQLMQGVQSGKEALLDAATQRVNSLTAEFQDAIMAARMQPVRNVFDIFQRTVRDLSHELGKTARLVIEDNSVELDKTIIEAIGDPLSHLIRNAVVHGIETPAERALAGKPMEGKLVLKASHSAGQVLVQLSDDGRGIDFGKIRDEALKRGLIKPHETNSISKKGWIDFLFRPGFSTSGKITQHSGRGVGLDVVKANLSDVGGTIQLESEAGKGSNFCITLPFTLAIMPSLLVGVEGERFAIPQVNVSQLVRVRAREVHQQIQKLAGVEVIAIRDKLLPVVKLKDLLDIEQPTFYDPIKRKQLPEKRVNIADRRSFEEEDPIAVENAADIQERKEKDRRQVRGAINIAVVVAADTSFGLVVDEFLDTAEIVVKPLGRHLRCCQCYAGATVLGDGRAALILDVVGLSEKANVSDHSHQTSSKDSGRWANLQVQKEQKLVLLVDGGDGERFALPLDVVQRVQKVSRSNVDMLGGRRVFRSPEKSTRLISLEDIPSTKPFPDKQWLYMVVFLHNGREMGLLVSNIIESVLVDVDQDTVTHRQPGIDGSLVLDDKIVLLLCLEELVAVVAPDQATPKNPKPKQSTPDEGTQGSQGKVLVVEDSTFFRNHIETIMKEAGYSVTKAENGACALKILKDESFDLVLTDLEMPILNGFELVQQIRKSPDLAHLPVMAVTSLLDGKSRERAAMVGIDEYSVKLDRDHVLSKCLALIHSRRPTKPSAKGA